jgi:hypothetical protein
MKKKKTKNLVYAIRDYNNNSKISGDNTSTPEKLLQNNASQKVTVQKHHHRSVLTKMH